MVPYTVMEWTYVDYQAWGRKEDIWWLATLVLICKFASARVSMRWK